jgi:hypothetical protein
MSKFKKRLVKNTKKFTNAVIIGDGFGYLEEICEEFATVFIHSQKDPEVRLKNLIIRNSLDSVTGLKQVSHIFIDRDYVKCLDYLTNMFLNERSDVIIEGEDPIDRTRSTNLYRHGYECVEKLGFAHYWKKVK